MKYIAVVEILSYGAAGAAFLVTGSWVWALVAGAAVEAIALVDAYVSKSAKQQPA